MIIATILFFYILLVLIHFALNMKAKIIDIDVSEKLAFLYFTLTIFTLPYSIGLILHKKYQELEEEKILYIIVKLPIKDTKYESMSEEVLNKVMEYHIIHQNELIDCDDFYDICVCLDEKGILYFQEGEWHFEEKQMVD